MNLLEIVSQYRMFDKYLVPLGILPLQGFGDHVKEEGGFGFIKSDLFMEMFGDTLSLIHI